MLVPFAPPSAPPGFLSPAAFPFPAMPFPQNDAPAPGAPYLIGTASGIATSVTLTVNAGSGTGDTLVVLTTGDGGNVALRCSDTEGNSYSLTVGGAVGAGERINQLTAVNPAPLKPGDQVTVTWAGSGFQGFTLIGLPGAAAGAPGGNLIPDAKVTTTAGGTSVVHASIAASSLNSPAEVAIGYILAAPGPVNWPPDWTVLTSAPFAPAPALEISVAYKVLTSRTQVAASFLFAGTPANSGLIITTYMPETRFAPKSPPDMPPGMMAPGAWQYAPLTRGGAVTSTRFFTAQPAITATITDQAGKQLTGAAATTGTIGRQPGKALAAAASVTGTVTRQAARALTGTAATAGNLGRQAARALAGTTAATGSITRQPRGNLTASASTGGSVTRQPSRTLAGTVATSGALTRTAARALAVVVAALATVTRQPGRVLSAAVTTAGALSRRAGKAMASAAVTAPAITRQAARPLSGTVTPSGTLGTAGNFSRAFAAAVTTAGTLARRAARTLAGTVTANGGFAGTVIRVIQKPVQFTVGAARVTWHAGKARVTWAMRRGRSG